MFCHCGRLAHSAGHRRGPNSLCRKQQSRDKRTEHDEPRRVSLQLTSHHGPSNATAFPTNNETPSDAVNTN